MAETHDALCLAIVNDEGQYSLWPNGKALPVGWRHTGKQGARSECLDYIRTAWTDMRPRSLQHKYTRTA